MKRTLRSAVLLLVSSALLLLMSVMVSLLTGWCFAQQGPPQQGKITIPYVPDSPRVLAFSTIVENQYQQITVVDPDFKSIAVYRVSLTDGKIYFCSQRRIREDLQLVQFNIDSDALPTEIQSLYQQ